MGYQTLSARRIAGPLGAEVEGLDLSQPLEDRQVAELNDALLAHQVVFLHGQQAMDDAAHLALARRFGELSVYPVLKALGGDQALEVIEDAEDNPPGADTWHTDVTWIEQPPKLAILAAQVIPEYGGDTLWASTTAAHDALSPVMQRMLSGLSVRHGLQESFWERVRAKAGDELCARARSQIAPEVEHPLIRTHPETGRRALFVAGGFMLGVKGMEPAESDLLLDFLMEHATQERFQVRWRWRAGDVAIWDERCTLHHALRDHYPQHRRMRRCTVDGDRPS
ncbi:MAG: TauD/TfdA dioxygenase family protein [Myxococcota bacterium]